MKVLEEFVFFSPTRCLPIGPRIGPPIGPQVGPQIGPLIPPPSPTLGRVLGTLSGAAKTLRAQCRCPGNRAAAQRVPGTSRSMGAQPCQPPPANPWVSVKGCSTSLPFLEASPWPSGAHQDGSTASAQWLGLQATRPVVAGWSQRWTLQRHRRGPDYWSTTGPRVP